MSTKGLLEEEKDKLSILNAFKYELGLSHDEFKSLFIESISHFKDIIDLKSEDTLEK